jgi:hypothetical protein
VSSPAFTRFQLFAGFDEICKLRVGQRLNGVCGLFRKIDRPLSDSVRRPRSTERSRLQSRWFSRDQALCVTTDSLVERLYAISVYQVPRPLREADSPKESGRWLHLHPPDAARILRRFDFSNPRELTMQSRTVVRARLSRNRWLAAGRKPSRSWMVLGGEMGTALIKRNFATSKVDSSFECGNACPNTGTQLPAFLSNLKLVPLEAVVPKPVARAMLNRSISRDPKAKRYQKSS